MYIGTSYYGTILKEAINLPTEIYLPSFTLTNFICWRIGKLYVYVGCRPKGVKSRLASPNILFLPFPSFFECVGSSSPKIIFATNCVN